MATIVLVHGIAQEQLSSDSLENEWIPAMAGGVRKAGFSEIADRLWRNRSEPRGIDTRMAFYGHLFLRPGQQGSATEELTVDEDAVAEQLALAWIERAAARSCNRKETRIAEAELAFLHHEIGEEEAGWSDLGRKAVKSLSKLRWFAPFGMALAERFAIKSLAQVTRYLTDDSVRSVALQTVLDLTGPDTKVIIGHSLGSVVAYEAAHRLGHTLPLLVTAGSPLGVDTIIYPRLRPQPPTYPTAVLRWVNVADRDDLVAAEPDLTNFFSSGLPSIARFEGAYTVDNGAKPHNVDFYLTKEQIGRPVGETLIASI